MSDLLFLFLAFYSLQSCHDLSHLYFLPFWPLCVEIVPVQISADEIHTSPIKNTYEQSPAKKENRIKHFPSGVKNIILSLEAQEIIPENTATIKDYNTKEKSRRARFQVVECTI
jgi:hypothetical protein